LFAKYVLTGSGFVWINNILKNSVYFSFKSIAFESQLVHKLTYFFNSFGIALLATEIIQCHHNLIKSYVRESSQLSTVK
jgi:hypothetical protein